MDVDTDVSVEELPAWTAPTFHLPANSKPQPPVIASYDPSEDSSYPGCFLRESKWSPDGSSLLTVAEDRTIRLFTLPQELLSLSLPLNSQAYSLKPTLSLPQYSPIISTLWYPSASIATEGSFCFLAAVDGGPVKLFDGIDGRLRASYPIIDHRERFIAPHSMCFNLTSTHLYCGFDSAIEIFDFSRPGDSGERLHTTKSKKTKGGQKGIISALDFSPFGGIYAAGSYSRSISIYTEGGGSTDAISLKGVVGGGVTQVKFHPMSSNYLFAASRLSNVIQSWDLRWPKKPLGEYTRQGKTNQRIGFGVEAWGRWLISGDQDGEMNFYPSSLSIQEGSMSTQESCFKIKVSDDSISSTSIHPYLPLIATTSGSRHLPPLHSSSSSSSSSDLSDADSESSSSSSSAKRNIIIDSTRPKNPFAPEDALLRILSFVAPSPTQGVDQQPSAGAGDGNIPTEE